MSGKERVIAIVQARMSSSRLPRKVLLSLAGRPTILHIVDRLRATRGVDDVVIACTATEDDEPLVATLVSEGVEVFAYDGDPNDLLTRYIAVGRHYDAGIILMVDGDCPLIDPDTGARMIDALRQAPDAEYVRIEPASIEGGMACVRLSTYERLDQEGAVGPYREHALLKVTEDFESFSIASIAPDPEFVDSSASYRFWLDTHEDYEFLSAVYDRLYQPGGIVDLRQVVALLKREPALLRMNAHVKQTDPLREPTPVAVKWPTDADRASLFESIRRALLDGHRFDVYDSNEISDDRPVVAMIIDAGDSAVDADVPLVVVPPNAATLGLERAVIAPLTAIERAARLEIVPCALCLSDEKTEVHRHPTRGIATVVCARCGLAYLSPRPTAEALAQFYAEYSQGLPPETVVREDGPFVRSSRSRADAATQVLSGPGKVVEIGCSYGLFLEEMVARGHDVLGLEPSKPESEVARSRLGPAAVRNAGLEALEPDGSNDLVALFHVLEHLRDPLTALRQIREALKPGGFVHIEVPNMLMVPQTVVEHVHFMTGQHLYGFTPNVLGRMLAEAGFEITKLEDDPLPPIYPSNLRALARRSESHATFGAVAPGETLDAMRRYHRGIDEIAGRIATFVERWRKERVRVALYGAGSHSMGVLDMVSFDGVDLRTIIDDDAAKHGNTLGGVVVEGPVALTEHDVQAILVSSLAAESVIVSKLGQLAQAGVEVVSMYNGEPHPPQPKVSYYCAEVP